VVGIVNLNDEVGDGELQLMRPQAPAIAARRKPVTHAQKKQDICRLPDDELAAFEERRREWRMLDARAVKQRHHRRHAAASARPARDIDVSLSKLFKREADELAASLDGGPVV
jgi:hypothetical protein